MSIVDVEGNFATFEGINDARWLAYTTTSTTVDEMVIQSALNTVRNDSESTEIIRQDYYGNLKTGIYFRP